MTVLVTELIQPTINSVSSDLTHFAVYFLDCYSIQVNFPTHFLLKLGSSHER